LDQKQKVLVQKKNIRHGKLKTQKEQASPGKGLGLAGLPKKKENK
jgi:hypothetical protein